MSWIEQPDRNNCGQVAVAVITGRPLAEVEEVVGHGHGTMTRELRAALAHFGYETANRCRPKPRPELGLAQVHDDGSSKRGWHWVVVHGHRIYDGVWGRPSGLYTEQRWPRGFRITSYLAVTRR